LQTADYRREAMDKPLRILRLPVVVERTGLKRDSIYRGARDGWFPRPVKIAQHASGWIEHEVDAFVARRIAARDAG
jgi:prophage regulatory protein